MHDNLAITGLVEKLLRVHRAVLAASDAAESVRRADVEIHGPHALLAVGKAARAMTLAAMERWGEQVVCGLVLTVAEHASDERLRSLGFSVAACDHPLPTPRNVDATRRVLRWLEQQPVDSALLVLLSGGASAHLCMPAPGLELDDIVAVTGHLQRSGADIHDLNCVRRHVEQLKGGRLALAASPRTVETLILSDVIGDPLHDVGSGPTVPDPTTYADALLVAERWGVRGVSPRVWEHLARGARGEIADTPKRDADFVPPPRAHVIASNTIVVATAERVCAAMGHDVSHVTRDFEGSSQSAARILMQHAHRAAARGTPACVVLGGEPTVDARGSKGVGGPSQELALRVAAELPLARPWALLTYSTDGRDGPTEYAGAIVTHETARIARERGVDLSLAASNHDASHALEHCAILLPRCAADTNLNHVAALLIA